MSPLKRYSGSALLFSSSFPCQHVLLNLAGSCVLYTGIAMSSIQCCIDVQYKWVSQHVPTLLAA